MERIVLEVVVVIVVSIHVTVVLAVLVVVLCVFGGESSPVSVSLPLFAFSSWLSSPYFILSIVSIKS